MNMRKKNVSTLGSTPPLNMQDNFLQIRTCISNLYDLLLSLTK